MLGHHLHAFSGIWIPSSTKKSWTPTETTFWICACLSSLSLSNQSSLCTQIIQNSFPLSHITLNWYHIRGKPVNIKANNKGKDQTVHMHSLILAFVAHCLDSEIFILGDLQFFKILDNLYT